MTSDSRYWPWARVRAVARLEAIRPTSIPTTTMRAGSKPRLWPMMKTRAADAAAPARATGNRPCARSAGAKVWRKREPVALRRRHQARSDQRADCAARAAAGPRQDRALRRPRSRPQRAASGRRRGGSRRCCARRPAQAHRARPRTVAGRSRRKTTATRLQRGEEGAAFSCDGQCVCEAFGKCEARGHAAEGIGGGQLVNAACLDGESAFHSTERCNCACASIGIGLTITKLASDISARRSIGTGAAKENCVPSCQALTRPSRVSVEP